MGEFNSVSSQLGIPNAVAATEVKRTSLSFKEYQDLKSSVHRDLISRGPVVAQPVGTERAHRRFGRQRHHQQALHQRRAVGLCTRQVGRRQVVDRERFGKAIGPVRAARVSGRSKIHHFMSQWGGKQPPGRRCQTIKSRLYVPARRYADR